MALLKELGRAAYENPLPRGPFCKQKGTRAMDPAEKDAERMAKSLMGESDVTEIRICPVCGVKALLVFGDIRSDVFFDDEEGQVIVTRAEFFTYAVRCLCCSFEIEDEIGDESFKGLPIKSYWRVEELILS